MVNSGLKWTTVQSAEIEQAKFRLEANVFNVEARAAKDTIKNSKYQLVNLWSAEGFVRSAFYPGRFKRVYVEKGNGYPMVLPSQLLSIKPIPTKFISQKTTGNIEILKVKRNTLLVTRSGTIGNCTIVTDTLDGVTMSDDVIRVSFKEEFGLGYTYTYLLTKVGKLILATNNYGSVVQHIEPEHFENVPIPNPPDEIKKSVHQKIIRSFELRDEGNKLIEQAEQILVNALKLPKFNNLTPKLYEMDAGVQTFSVKLDLLDSRFEGSYHSPTVSKIIDCLLDSGARILPLGNSELTKNIYIPNRFKRIYVEEEEGNGVPFFSGRCLHELDPANKKYISAAFHKDRIGRQLLIKEGMILVTCSGTTGKVNIVPRHWDDWVMTHDIIRTVPTSKEITGYLYVWLNSEFGRELIQRNDYGSVVPHIEAEHLQRVPIPMIYDSEKIKEINDLALRAVKLRSEAYDLEQAAIKQVNEEVIYA